MIMYNYVPSLNSFSGRQNNDRNEYARVEQCERAKKCRIQRDKSPSSTLNETREDKNDTTTLKSKANQLMKEKEALAKELPIILILFIMY